jgi:DNA-binding response OmpR family regulator
MRIGVVEDNERLAGIIQHALVRSGLPVDVYANSRTAQYGLKQHDYAVLIVDRGLPDGDGLSLIKKLRAEGNGIPCLVLTARDAIHDRVDGLENGADDYLTKPFALEELVARVKAMLRRRQQVAPLSFRIGNLCVDLGTARVSVDGNPISCTSGEFRLLSVLAERKGAVISRDELADAAFGPFAELTANTVEVAIHRLRRRLRDAHSQANVINHRGVGYALSLVAAEKP